MCYKGYEGRYRGMRAYVLVTMGGNQKSEASFLKGDA